MSGTTAAVVVLYRPDASALENIHSYRDQVDLVIAVDNSESPDPSIASQLEGLGAHYVELGQNRGIAAALNVGCDRARALGAEWALTLDQDSTATPDLVARLHTCVDDPTTSADVAIVAPVWQQVGGLAVPNSPTSVPLEFAMTSGSLTRLSTHERLGGFREDLFIDRVDNEYCLRARRAGWRILQRRDAVLLHRMGALRRVRFPVRCWVTDYTPLRRYYMVRNLLEVRREFGREFPKAMAIERSFWRKEIVKILLAEHGRTFKLAMMFLGWSDFRRRRFGKFEDLHGPQLGRVSARTTPQPAVATQRTGGAMLTRLAKRGVRFVNSHQDVVELRRKAPEPVRDIRRIVADMFLSGEGVEIGALNAPLSLPPTAHVRYVDRMGVDDLKRHYPGLDLVAVDVIDDGEHLDSIAPSSQDFIVANHFLEHCQDPIGALKSLSQKLKVGGVLYMAVPDADDTFDVRRASTEYEHLRQDHERGPEPSRPAHFEEWVSLVEGLDDEDARARIDELLALDYSIHFHVWRQRDLVGFLFSSISEYGIPLALEATVRNGLEIICVLQRRALD